MTNRPFELWAQQLRRTKEYEACRALIAKRAALTKRSGETDTAPKSTDRDAAFVAQFDDRTRRLEQLLDAIAEARRVKPKRPPEEPQW
jgi:hypothetical protein